ncbi:hypothetical protein QBC37DRAFT_332689 [Rhypophila decipiens]|uniref:Uncharacterized protein n=1 Tax=Rhypophila decipiens TaxID=261697 RepID=A0AAN7BAJ8_9PEZI|nr:hypothetical protein QBC37DRAFT_332689 [Rhypophila decipiens]
MEPPTPTENRFFRRESQASQSPSSPNQQQPPRIQTESLATQTSQPPFHPLFPKKIQTLSLPLAPFVQLTSGLVHPAFPQTLLHFWLLTSDQLDALAAFYHQSPPCEWTAHYPCPIVYHADLSLEEKRRKIGKFIGLRGCETPVQTNVDENNNGFWGRAKTEDEIMEDARRARMNQEEDEIRRKMGWY